MKRFYDALLKLSSSIQTLRSPKDPSDENGNKLFNYTNSVEDQAGPEQFTLEEITREDEQPFEREVIADIQYAIMRWLDDYIKVIAITPEFKQDEPEDLAKEILLSLQNNQFLEGLNRTVYQHVSRYTFIPRNSDRDSESSFDELFEVSKRMKTALTTAIQEGKFPGYKLGVEAIPFLLDYVDRSINTPFKPEAREHIANIILKEVEKKIQRSVQNGTFLRDMTLARLHDSEKN